MLSIVRSSKSGIGTLLGAAMLTNDTIKVLKYARVDAMKRHNSREID
jgi:hypothetical protein